MGGINHGGTSGGPNTGGTTPTGGTSSAGSAGDSNAGTAGGDAGAGGSEAGGGGSVGAGGSGGSEHGGATSGGEGGAGGGGSEERLLWLGTCTPLDLSDDGQTLLAREGVWTEQSGWVSLPDLPGGEVRNTPRVLSGDGRVVYGSSSSALGDEIYRWTADGGIQGLGQLYLDDGGLEPNEVPSATHSIDTTRDGSLLVGFDSSGEATLFRWTASEGIRGGRGFVRADPRLRGR